MDFPGGCPQQSRKNFRSGWGFLQLQFSPGPSEAAAGQGNTAGQPSCTTSPLPPPLQMEGRVRPVHRAQQEWETRNNKYGRGVLGPPDMISRPLSSEGSPHCSGEASGLQPRRGGGSKQTSTGRTACEVCDVCIAHNFLPLPLRAFCCVFLSGLQPLRVLPAHQDVSGTGGRRSARRLQRWEAKAPLDGMFWNRGWAKCVLTVGGQLHGQGGQPARHWLKQTAASIIPAGCMAFCLCLCKPVCGMVGRAEKDVD